MKLVRAVVGAKIEAVVPTGQWKAAGMDAFPFRRPRRHGRRHSLRRANGRGITCGSVAADWATGSVAPWTGAISPPCWTDVGVHPAGGGAAMLDGTGAGSCICRTVALSSSRRRCKSAIWVSRGSSPRAKSAAASDTMVNTIRNMDRRVRSNLRLTWTLPSLGKTHNPCFAIRCRPSAVTFATIVGILGFDRTGTRRKLRHTGTIGRPNSGLCSAMALHSEHPEFLSFVAAKPSAAVRFL